MQKLLFSLVIIVLFVPGIAYSQEKKTNSVPLKWVPENLQVAAAMTNRDIKELARLKVIQGAAEVDTVVRVYVDEWGKRNEWEDALISYLEHEDVTIIGNVSFFLGQMKCKRAVPELIALLQSDRWLIKPWSQTNGNYTTWGRSNARSRIIEALGNIGDQRAVYSLEAYLKPNKHEIYPGNAAYALYKITGKIYKYVDHGNKEKAFVPPND